MTDLEVWLSDENNWIPSSLVVKLFENARLITGNPQVAFDIGFETITHREFSYIQRFFLSVFSSPRGTLRRINQINAKLNSTKIIEPVYDTPGRFVVRWHWREGVISSKDVCSYNKGIYSAIPTLWGVSKGKVEENSCHFEGGDYCEVVISWATTTGRLRNILLQLFTNKSNLLNALEEIERDKALLKQKYAELSTLNTELSQRVSVLKSINNATRALVSTPDTQMVLEQTMKPIVNVLGFDRALIMLLDEKEEFLEYRYGIGESAEMLRKIENYRIPLTREQNLMVRVLRKKRPVLIRDAKASGLNPANVILADFSPSSFIVCPLIAEEKTIGILGADRSEDKPPLGASDAEFLSIFANNIATALKRAQLDDELKGSYVSSVRALVKAIEEKDTYTKGHSERVARIALEVAHVLGMSESESQYLSFGSILHDVGKIGIPESIVRSPKPLTEAEFKVIKKHPLKGVEILHPISFIRNHMHLIRSHHERWDGKGYPDKLSGSDIPLGAQIVAVADAFDAMTSSRPYRKGMPQKQAAREITKNSGTQFSPEVADAFIKAFERGIPDLKT
jgi:putative nucleotidyltransferase with HDIG domain